MTAELLHHSRREVARIGGHEAQTAKPGKDGEASEQIGEIGGISLTGGIGAGACAGGSGGRRGLPPVVDSLSEQLDLDEAEGEQVANFALDFGGAPAGLGTPGGRHDAEGATLVAALDDRDHPLVEPVARNGVEFVPAFGGKSEGDDPLAGCPPGEEVGELPHPRRTEDEIEVRHARQDLLAFLLGDAAAEADLQVRALTLQQAVFAEPRIDLLYRLRAHAAGVEEDQIGFGGVVGGQKPLLHQLAGHALAVQLVHLAAPRFDVKAA